MDLYIIIFCGALLIIVVIQAVMLEKIKRHSRETALRLQMERENDVITHSFAIADGFYDNVLEADITNNKLQGKNCEQVVFKLGLPADAAYSECIEMLAKTIVREDFQDIYRESFDRQRLTERYAKGERKFVFEFIERADLQNFCWTRVTVCIFYSEAGKTLKIISYVKNIQKEKERELALLNEAQTDYLTGLYNKRATEKLVYEAIADSKTVSHALMLIDIDFFKQVNDNIGHTGGDEALRKVGTLLQKLHRSGDISGRIGGDEFLIFLRDCKSVQAVTGRARLLLQEVSALDMSPELKRPLSFSIGIALYPEHADNYPDLFTKADAALYDVKKYGRNNYRFYGQKVSPD